MTDGTLWYKPKLIEVALPLEDINRESTRENYIYRGNPSAIHLWWSRKPLAASRAVLFAQLVDDPSAHPEKFSTEADQVKERKRLHDIISELVKWENLHNESLLQQARAEIRKSTGPNPPQILDPFAGGGSIPLEAQRLGLQAHASDLNPVAVLINKAMIEIPSKWTGRVPIFPGAAAEAQSWPGLTGLAEDVRRYGTWMRDEAEKRIGNLYPKVKVAGAEVPVIAWIWTRTVKCPNPACGGTMPLVNKFWLSQKKGKERYARPLLDGKRIKFEIAGPDGKPKQGTVSRTGAVCILCDTPVPLSYIRAEGKAGRLGAQLMAIAAEGKRQRYYLAPTEEHERAADIARPDDVPEAELPEQALGFRVQGYGMRTWADLFTNRQLTALTTFSRLIREVHIRASDDGANPEYADAIACYLAFVVSKLADYNCTGAIWYAREDRPKNLFARQAIPMAWEYPEINVFARIGGTWEGCLKVVSGAISGLVAVPEKPGCAEQADAADRKYSGIVCTDPPYYDNVGYADLSDFFYIWLRDSVRKIFPDLMTTMLTPKSGELVADPFRLGGKTQASSYFKSGFEHVFHRICLDAPSDFPITVFYAFKQAEADDEGAHASTGWETLLEGMLRTGWMVTGTWPMRTERRGRARDIKSNALASSIVLACRPRPADAVFTDRRGLIAALREEMPGALQKIEWGNVAPVDLRQAAIGPGMAVFSRYARVNEPDGTPMRVRTALSLINQVLDEWLAQLEGDVSADTRWCVEWFKGHGFEPGGFGDADTLSRGTDTDTAALDRAGVLRARTGKVRLLPVRDIQDDYDPVTDDRPSEWKVCLHLAKRLKEQGAGEAAALMASARDAVDLDAVKELAYLLYSIADKKGWAEIALLFNGLGTSWTDLEDAARKLPGSRPVAAELRYGD